MSAPINLRLAVCLFDDVTSLDYQGPLALFGFLEPEVVKVLPIFANSPPKYTFEVTYLAHTLDPVKSSPGPPVVPSRTYDDIKADEQFDVILIPGGELLLDMSLIQPSISITDISPRSLRPSGRRPQASTRLHHPPSTGYQTHFNRLHRLVGSGGDRAPPGQESNY